MMDHKDHQEIRAQMVNADPQDLMDKEDLKVYKDQ